jgi:hypothetical protein
MLQSGKHEQWTDAPISILNGGGIRASIDEKQNNGNNCNCPIASLIKTFFFFFFNYKDLMNKVNTLSYI